MRACSSVHVRVQQSAHSVVFPNPTGSQPGAGREACLGPTGEKGGAIERGPVP
jgi:hypothetical protein